LNLNLSNSIPTTVMKTNVTRVPVFSLPFLQRPKLGCVFSSHFSGVIMYISLTTQHGKCLWLQKKRGLPREIHFSLNVFCEYP